MHKFVAGDCVSWEEDGTVYRGEIIFVKDTFARILIGDYDLFLDGKTVPIEKLEYMPPLELSCDEYRRLVHMERDMLKLFDRNYPHNIHNAGGYRFTVYDLLIAIEKLNSREIDYGVRALWRDCIDGELSSQISEDGVGFYNETDVLRSLRGYLYTPWLGYENAIAEGKVYIEDREKLPSRRRYPLYVKEALLEKLESDTAMNAASDEEVELYRLFAEELEAKGNEYGIRAVGYGCYGGNRAFPCDWVRSRDCMLRLLQMEDGSQSKAIYANTLGYIYYYGRCNGGVPEYDSAYKYFSFAALGGVYEAQYKVADMLRNGYGVPRSEEVANGIIFNLYSENLRYMREGNFECKFADIALRMGRIYDADGEGELWTALYYYMQAEFAIRMRMLKCDYYGDERVRENNSSAISKLKEKMGFEEQKSAIGFPNFIKDELEDGRKLDIVIQKKTEHSYKITFAPHRKRYKGEKRQMFITVPEIGFCGMLSKLTVTYNTRIPICETLLDKVLTVDELKGKEFLYDGETVFMAQGDDFVTKISSKRWEKKYRFVSVSFGGNELFDYLCDDPSVKVGDTVTVIENKEKKKVTVCRVFEKTGCETALPIEVYTSILGKNSDGW